MSDAAPGVVIRPSGQGRFGALASQLRAWAKGRAFAVWRGRGARRGQFLEQVRAPGHNPSGDMELFDKN